MRRLSDPPVPALDAGSSERRTSPTSLAKELAALDKLKGPALAKQRYDMFRTMGQGLPPAEKEEP